MNNYELHYLDLIQEIRTPFGDTILPIITHLGDSGIFWICLAVVLLIIPKTRKLGLTITCALVFDVILCNGILKPLIARVRPYDINTGIQLLIGKPNDFSFPSGHTAASFASAFALLFAGQKKAGVAATILAAVIAFSRLYLYVHYPTDVLGGIVVGLICGYAGNKVIERICRN